MSTESLKRVLLRLKDTARDIRKKQHTERQTPKPAPKADAVGKIRELLTKG